MAKSTCKILEHLFWSNTSGFQFWGPLARTNFLSALCGPPNTTAVVFYYDFQRDSVFSTKGSFGYVEEFTCFFCPWHIPCAGARRTPTGSKRVPVKIRSFASDLICPPKGPFRTKNAIAMEIVAFCCRGSLSLSVPIRCHFPRKNRIQITIAVVNYYRGSKILSPQWFTTRSVFLVPKGPLGRADQIGKIAAKNQAWINYRNAKSSRFFFCKLYWGVRVWPKLCELCFPLEGFEGALKGTNLTPPKGPCRSKNAMALESIVFPKNNLRLPSFSKSPHARRMKLLFSNYLGDYSYSFQGSSELIRITVTVALCFSCRMQLQEVTPLRNSQEFPAATVTWFNGFQI